MNTNQKDKDAALGIMLEMAERMGGKTPNVQHMDIMRARIIDALAIARLDAIEEFKQQKKHDLEAEGNFAGRDESHIAREILDNMAKRTWTDDGAEQYLGAHLESFFAAGYAAAMVRLTGSCDAMQMREGSPFKGRIIDCRGDVPIVRTVESIGVDLEQKQ